MPLKITLKFTLGRATWGEAHILGSGTDPDGGVEQNFALKLAQARSGLCGANCGIFAAELTSMTIKRNVTTLRFPQPLTGFIGGEGEEGTLSADIPNTSIVVNAKTDTYKRQFRVYLAGCIDEAIRTDPAFPENVVPDPNFVVWFNKFKNFLLAGKQWGTMVKTNPQSVDVTPPLATNAQYPGLVGVTLPTPLAVGITNLGVGAHLQLRGFKRRNLAGQDANGIWQIYAVIPGTGTIVTYMLAGSGGIDPSNFWKHGVAQTIVPVFDPYILYDYEKASSRKRGGSIELPRGRSRTRRLHA